MLEAVRSGSALANLLPSNTSRRWPLVEDVCVSFTAMLQECKEHHEFTATSIDGTFRVCLTILEQVPFNAPKKAQARPFLMKIVLGELSLSEARLVQW